MSDEALLKHLQERYVAKEEVRIVLEKYLRRFLPDHLNEIEEELGL